MEAFYDDIIRVGLGRCDPRLVQILVEESGDRFLDLISFGIRFRRNPKNGFIRVPGCFSTVERAYVADDPRNIRESFARLISGYGISFIHAALADLVVADGACRGAWVLPSGSATLVQIRADATILATGGAGSLFLHHLSDGDALGEGAASAHRAGAELINLEFIQFMLGVQRASSRRFLPLIELRHPGVLRNGRGDDVIREYIPDPEVRHVAISERQGHFPFSCRDRSGLIDLAVAAEQKRGNTLYWKPGAHSPSGEVLHFAHAVNGGIRIDENAESTVPGLYAAGEAAAGSHGADRIGGCMITATQVFGHRAGTHAAKRSLGTGALPSANPAPDPPVFYGPGAQDAFRINELIKEIKTRIERGFGVLRDGVGITRVMNRIEEIQKDCRPVILSEVPDPDAVLRLRSMLAVGMLMAESALKNRACMGSHCRNDTSEFPDLFGKNGRRTHACGT